MGYFGDEFEENVNVTGPGPSNTGANISGGSGLVGGILQTGMAPIMQKWSQDTAKHEAGQAWERSMKAWEMQNEYNHPKAKMERLEEAGLNPNLVYGKGIDTNSSGAPKSPVAQVIPKTLDINPMLGMQLLKTYEEIKSQKIDNHWKMDNVREDYGQKMDKGQIIEEWLLQEKEKTKSATSKAQIDALLADLQGFKTKAGLEGIMPGMDFSAGRIMATMEEGPARTGMLNALALMQQIQKSIGLGKLLPNRKQNTSIPKTNLNAPKGQRIIRY